MLSFVCINWTAKFLEIFERVFKHQSHFSPHKNVDVIMFCKAFDNQKCIHIFKIKHLLEHKEQNRCTPDLAMSKLKFF